MGSYYVLRVTWRLHCGGIGREEEDEGDAAVAAESGGVEATNGRVRVCDGLLVVYTSAYKERRDREIHQRSFIGRWFLYAEVIHFAGDIYNECFRLISLSRFYLI